MRQNKLETQDVVVMYTQQHLTLRQIAPLVGMTAQAILKRLRKAGVRRTDGTHVQTECGTCGNLVDRTRKRWKINRQSFCNTDCYAVYLQNPSYNPWRQGSRIARAIVAEHFRLLPEHVVHHEDANQRNNDLRNLKVFASQSDHLRYHHGNPNAIPLWDGSML